MLLKTPKVTLLKILEKRFEHISHKKVVDFDSDLWREGKEYSLSSSH